jgi:hypothetical protein
MCFSAVASFSLAGVLTVAGVASIRKVSYHAQIPFAAIPLIFAVQQISEGFNWLSLNHFYPPGTQVLATYVFLFFAQIIWPVWVPLAIILLREKRKRGIAEKFLVATGAAVSLYLFYCLVTFRVSSEIVGNHIAYIQDYPRDISRYCGILYMIATLLPCFFSGIKHMWVLGAAILISYIFTAVFYRNYIISVWCFLAAAISVIVFALLNNKQPNGNL